MNRDAIAEKRTIDPDLTILDIVSKYRETETIFKKYDEKAGVCLCCEDLFNSLKDIADKYCMNLEEIIADLQKVIEDSS